MKYQCTHCNHVFESAETEVRHCPKCFWTTSVIPLSDKKADSAKVEVKEKLPKPATRSKGPLVIFFILIVITAGIGSYVFFIVFQPKRSGTNIKIESSLESASAKAKSLNKKSKEAKEQSKLDFLTDEERKQLNARFELQIPRQLSADEEEILKKQVSFSSDLDSRPTLSMWGKEDFKNFLKAEQARKKIPLGGFYIRKLNKLFEERYLKAAELIKAGSYFEAREELLKALMFPVYQNDIKMHRAVALVMLRSYVNDILGKIVAINQYLYNQRLSTQAAGIYKNYQHLFSAIDLKDWDGALSSIKSLRAQAAAFENDARDNNVQYPPTLNSLDQELQAAVVKTTKPDAKKAIDLKGLLIDLDLKERVVKDNQPDSIAEAQKQYRKAFSMIETEDWQGALQKLAEIIFPPELAEDARNKMAIIQKITAVDESANAPAKAERS